MAKTFDRIKDGKHVEIWTPTAEDIEKAKKHNAEMQERLKARGDKRLYSAIA